MPAGCRARIKSTVGFYLLAYIVAYPVLCNIIWPSLQLALERLFHLITAILGREIRWGSAKQ